MLHAQRLRSDAIDTGILSIATLPFPHVMQDSFLDEDLFVRLRNSFPQCPPAAGPTGYCLYPRDSGYEQLMETNEAWRTLFNRFHQQQFIDWAIRQFGSEWQKDGCSVDLSKARYVQYHEDRIDKQRHTLRQVELQPHELWVRLDIYQGHVGYRRPIHVDYARRLMTMLVYFSDHDEDGMEGGELVLHPKRWKRLTQPVKTITPRENRMVAFPCSDRSYHSVPKITAARRLRNYVQVHISSSIAAWPRGETWTDRATPARLISCLISWLNS
jgi:hypothetical protein